MNKIKLLCFVALFMAIPLLYMRHAFTESLELIASRGSPTPTNKIEAKKAGKTSSRGPRKMPPYKRETEPDEQLRKWNEPYHGKRSELRKQQELSTTGPFDLHTFYTIDCTYHSLWQVLTLEMTWEEVQQGGFISRVVSGCDKFPDKQPAISNSILSPKLEPQFGAYFAPTFSTLPNGQYYAPYNRPNAIFYWLTHADLTEDVFVALDPDMIYLHKLPYDNVLKGHPVSHYYIYMMHTQFQRYNCELCPKDKYDKSKYEVGPPWMWHIDDLRTIMPTWIKLVPMLKAIDNNWIVEMVAYAVAMAYHNLPHEVIHYGMVDNVKQEHAWSKGDALDETGNPGSSNHPAALLHYCYTWEVGEKPPKDGMGAAQQYDRMIKREQKERHPVIDYFHFSKYRVPTDWPGGKQSFRYNFVSCESPLLQEFHTMNALPGIEKEDQWRRTCTFLDLLLPAVNRAMTKWKVKNCKKEGQTVNLAKTLRTAHPAYWESKYEIEKYNDDKKTVVLKKKVVETQSPPPSLAPQSHSEEKK